MGEAGVSAGCGGFGNSLMQNLMRSGQIHSGGVFFMKR
jgi:hypothetical protein